MAHGCENGECHPVTLGGIINKAGDGRTESGTGHGKQTRQSRNGRKGKKAETLADDQRLHHDNRAHGQAERKGAQVQYDDMIVMGQGEHGRHPEPENTP